MTLVYSPDRPVSQSDLLALYGSVGWSSYTRDPAGLHRAVAGSLWRMGAWDGPELVGLVRAVGDGLGRAVGTRFQQRKAPDDERPLRRGAVHDHHGDTGRGQDPAGDARGTVVLIMRDDEERIGACVRKSVDDIPLLFDADAPGRRFSQRNGGYQDQGLSFGLGKNAPTDQAVPAMAVPTHRLRIRLG